MANKMKTGSSLVVDSNNEEDNSNSDNNDTTMQPLTNSKKYIENVNHITSTIFDILCVFGVNEHKAQKANSHVMSAFIQFDEKPTEIKGVMSKNLRKSELRKALEEACEMNTTDVELAYQVIKHLFNAFYHRQSVRYYDPGYFDNSKWQQAKHTILNEYFLLKGGDSSSTSPIVIKIDKIIENYGKTIQDRVQYENRSILKNKFRPMGISTPVPKYGSFFQKDFLNSLGLRPLNYSAVYKKHKIEETFDDGEYFNPIATESNLRLADNCYKYLKNVNRTINNNINRASIACNCGDCASSYNGSDTYVGSRGHTIPLRGGQELESIQMKLPKTKCCRLGSQAIIDAPTNYCRSAVICSSGKAVFEDQVRIKQPKDSLNFNETPKKNKFSRRRYIRRKTLKKSEGQNNQNTTTTTTTTSTSTSNAAETKQKVRINESTNKSGGVISLLSDLDGVPRQNRK